MADTPPTELGQAAVDKGSNYGDTIVETGAYAHLGDLHQQLNVEGGLYLNLYYVHSPIAYSLRTRTVRIEHQESLRRYREIMAAIAETLDKDLWHTQKAAARCICQLAKKTVEDVDAFLSHNTITRKVLTATRLARRKVQKGYKPTGRRGVPKSLPNVEERLDMFEFLLATYKS